MTFRPPTREIEPPLPHNLDAERSVLGAILLDNNALSSAMLQLTPSDFFLRQNKIIFAQMLAMRESNIAIDDVTIMDALKADLEAAGGAAYLSTLADGIPRVTNVEHYARIVKKKSTLRKLAYAGAAIQEQALAAEHESDEVLSRARDTLSRIAEDSTSAGNDLFDTPEEIEHAPPLRFAVRGFLQCEAATLIAGLSGDFKTWLALSVAKGLLDESQMLWDSFPILQKARRVIYLIPESSRGPFRYRLEVMGLMSYVRDGRLSVRTLSKGPAPLLQDPKLLAVAQGSDLFLDTAVRFMQGDENNAGDNARGLATDIFALQAAGARSITAIAHSPKGFAKENFMDLENMVRGSGDIGAMFATAWGIRQLPGSIVHIQNIKPRDFDPCGPFQLAARPYITERGDFILNKAPGSCGLLADEMPDTMQNRGRKPSGASTDAREAKAAKLALLLGYLKENPKLSTQDIAELYSKSGIRIEHGTIRAYKSELTKCK